jgi:DNA-binding IclR family transcriptional regulator
MINAGYLAHDVDGRSVLPTGRVALLGRWVQPAVARPDLKRLMLNLREVTGHTIVLGVPQGIFVRYIDVISGRLAMRLEIPVGTKMPILTSGMGTLLLSAMDDKVVAETRQRTERALTKFGPDAIRASHIADLWNANPTVAPLSVLMSEIRKVRSNGFSISLDVTTLGAGIVCMLLPTNAGEQPLGVGVAGLSAIIKRDRDLIVSTMIEESRKLDIDLQTAHPQIKGGKAAAPKA